MPTRRAWRRVRVASARASTTRRRAREYNASTRARYRVLSFRDTYRVINAIRHMLGLDDLPWEARCE